MYSTQADFTNQVSRLVKQSSHFIENMKTVKPMQSGTSGLLEKIKKEVYSSEVTNVSNIGIDLEVLDTELQKILAKFFLVQSSYNRDATLKSFLGDFNQNKEDSYTKLVSYSDGCIKQIDSVITAYSRVEKGITKADLWIKHMLSNYSPKKVSDKARNSRKVIIDLSKIVAHVRNMSHTAKLELLNIRNLSARHTKPQIPRGE